MLEGMTKPKRPRDTNQLAKFVVGLATGQIAEPDPLEGKNRQRAESGRQGGLKGGAARAQSLLAKERRNIAIRAASVRWRKTD